MVSQTQPVTFRSTRAWLAAFQRGFERTPPALLEPVNDHLDLASNEMMGLLELADLRLLEEAQGDSSDASIDH
ncbi:MAG: hypothetical protein EON93_11205 [Burkholderiales bacterium]|nr:MAG: hypothetical protein EON93_11205 [Burkholderiales bacterium]